MSGATKIFWDDDPLASSYTLYRASLANLSDLSCVATGQSGNATKDDGTLPAGGSAYYFLVGADNCSGGSTLGLGRPASPACP